MKHDRLVLTLLAHDARRAWRSLSLSSALWIIVGGGLLVAYALADVWVGLLREAAHVRSDQGLWLVRGPAVIAAIAVFVANLTARLAARRALAPFLRVQPIAEPSRWRMVIVAGAGIALPLAFVAAALITLAAVIVGKPWALLWGLAEAGAGLLVFAVTFRLRVATEMRHDGVRLAAVANTRGPLLFGVRVVDGAPLPWVGAWAWGLEAGRVRLTLRLIALVLPIVLTGILAMAASLAQHTAGPAAAAALLGGLAVFMLSLRYAPLESPVLRTSPIGFGRAWRRLLRLPLMLSSAFFVVPASAASAAEPSTIAARVQDGVGLMVLDATYAIFAAYFSLSPLAGAVSFFVAVVYALYEASEFSGAMVVGFAALAVFLWVRTRRRYLYG